MAALVTVLKHTNVHKSLHYQTRGRSVMTNISHAYELKNMNDNPQSISDLHKYLVAGCRMESVKTMIFASDPE